MRLTLVVYVVSNESILLTIRSIISYGLKTKSRAPRDIDAKPMNTVTNTPVT